VSYCALVPFRDHLAETDDVEFRNAHGCTALIWDALCKRYGVWDRYGYQGPEAWSILWKRANPKHERPLPLEPWEQFVLSFTYDWALTRREHLNELADALAKFSEVHGDARYVNHLPAIADRLRELAKDETVEAVGLYGMSCGDSLWSVRNPETEESEPYDLTKHDKHWFTTEAR